MRKIFSLVLGFFVFVSVTKASTPQAWNKYHKEVATVCERAGNLKNAHVVGDIISFDDDIGITAAMVFGNYPQSFMHNTEGHFLCLFNKKTKQAQCAEASQWPMVNPPINNNPNRR